jgi:hypothetical protein
MHKNRMETLGMLGGCTPAGADIGSQNHGNFTPTAEHVVHLGHLVDDHIHAAGGKIDEHDLGYRPHPG